MSQGFGIGIALGICLVALLEAWFMWQRARADRVWMEVVKELSVCSHQPDRKKLRK